MAAARAHLDIENPLALAVRPRNVHLNFLDLDNDYNLLGLFTAPTMAFSRFALIRLHNLANHLPK